MRILVALFALILASPALANHDAYYNGVLMHQHETRLPVCIKGATAEKRLHVERARQEWNQRTLLRLPRVACDDPQRRIVVRFAALSTAGYATFCWHCDRTRAVISRFLPLSWVRAIACHELGHLLGLDHGGAACMTSIPKSRHPSEHDVAQVNENYTNPH